MVKDVERIGDYAKNLCDIADLVDEPMPEGPLVDELLDIRKSVETLAQEAAVVFQRSDKARATQLTREGRSVAKRCDELVRKVANGDFPPGLAVKVALGARFYKRIEAHFLNVISAVIMPVHKLDFFDEDVLVGIE